MRCSFHKHSASKQLVTKMKLFGGKSFKDVLRNSFFLTIAVFALSYPYLYHYIVHRPDYLSKFNEKISNLSTLNALLFSLDQLIIFIVLIYICSFVGFGFSEKYKFKGLGKFGETRKDLKYLLLVAIPLNIAIYLAFDKSMQEKIPTLYPDSYKWGLAKALMSSSTFEVVSKFGLVTIVMGIFRNKHLAVILPAIFFAILVPKTFADYGVEFGRDYLSIMALSLALVYGIASGYLYVYRGLITVFVLRLLLDLKYFIYPLLN